MIEEFLELFFSFAAQIGASSLRAGRKSLSRHYRNYSGLFLIALMFAVGVFTPQANASLINYSTTGTLTKLSGTDLLGLDQNQITLTNSLDTNAVPVSTTLLSNNGIRDVYSTTATVSGNITLPNLPATVTITWYPVQDATHRDSIVLSADASLGGITGNFTSTIPLTLSSAAPSPLLVTPITGPQNASGCGSNGFSCVTVTAKPFENATFGISGNIQGVGQVSGVPEPGTLSMLCGGLGLAAIAYWRKRRS